MSIKFAGLNLDKNILSAICSEGYKGPTPTQVQAIPSALNGRDITTSAQTGSGKIAAFLLPTLQRLTKRSEKPGKGPRALMLTPIRELATQAEKNALAYAENMRWLRAVDIAGGASFGYQARALSKSVDLTVATPGRLMDLIQSGRADFICLEMLILDEANRMLDMGFIDDIETIVEATPIDRQTLLFSTTWDGVVGKLARKLTKDPETIEVERVDSQGKIEEQLPYCDDMHHENRLLDHTLRDANIDQCVIFAFTKAMTEVIVDELYEKSFAANYLHGDMPQGWRNRTLMDLRKGHCKILVATDVAARDIGVPTITHVINYDLSKQAEGYIHCIDHTGRAGRIGTAITFAEVNEYVKIHKIEKCVGRKLPELTIESIEPTCKRKPAGGKPKGKDGWGDRKSGGWRDDKKPGKEGFGGKPRGGDHKKDGFKKGGFRKDDFKKSEGLKKGDEDFKGRRKSNDSFGGKHKRG